MEEPLLPYQSEVLPEIEADGSLKIGNFIMESRIILGKGSYATVFQGYKVGQESVKLAIKEIELPKHKKTHEMQKLMTNLKREISILQKLDHPNVIKIIDVIYYPERVYIILEMCSHGDLQQLLKKKENMGKNGGRFEEKKV